MKLIYDKIQFYGGGERVLLQIDKILNPSSIITLYNINDRNLESINNKTLYPSWGKYFSKLKFYILFYPFICLLVRSIKVRAETIFCYSSSCGKFFRLSAKRKILYTNFPARGIIEPNKFIKNKILLFFARVLIGLYKKYERMQYKKFDEIYCISEYTKKILWDNFKIHSEVIYCPTSQIFFDKHNVKKTINPFFLLVSRLEPHKNLDYVFQGFSSINEKLIVVGEGSFLKKYKNLYPKIDFKGFIKDSEMILLLSQASASIIPTVHEYSLPIIESFARGTPVIAIKSPASCELVEENPMVKNIDLGVIYNNPDEQSLISAIKKFNTRDQLYNKKLIMNYSKIFSPKFFNEKLTNIIISSDH